MPKDKNAFNKPFSPETKSELFFFIFMGIAVLAFIVFLVMTVRHKKSADPQEPAETARIFQPPTIFYA